MGFRQRSLAPWTMFWVLQTNPAVHHVWADELELTFLGYESLAPLPPAAASATASAPAWQDRTIASSRLRLLEYSAFMEVQRDPDTVMWGWWGVWPKIQHPAQRLSSGGPPACRLTPVRPSPQYSKHLFVHIGQTNPAFSDPPLEAVDVRQIYDKFPEKKGGLKELYEKGPPNAFFLVKFWVRPLLTPDGQRAQLPACSPPLVGPWVGPAGPWVGGMEAWRWGKHVTTSPLQHSVPSPRLTSTAQSRKALGPSTGSARSTAQPTA